MDWKKRSTVQVIVTAAVASHLAVLGGCGAPPAELLTDSADMGTPLTAEQQGSEQTDVSMERSIMEHGCELIEGVYWEEDFEYGCELESGSEIVCDEDGECAPAKMISLDSVLERFRLLELFDVPSTLDARQIAIFNNGDGPITIVPGEVIDVEPVTGCDSPGNVFVDVDGTAECHCDIGFLKVGTEQNGDPMCALDWHGDGAAPPTPQPPPPPPPPPEPTCTQEELLRTLQRAEQDYLHCVYGAINSLQRYMQVLVLGTGAAVVSGGTSLALGAADAVSGGAVIADYQSSIADCEYSFCTSIKRTLEDCNIPVPSDPPDELCDENW